jgi:hypothetical protein
VSVMQVTALIDFLATARPCREPVCLVTEPSLRPQKTLHGYSSHIFQMYQIHFHLIEDVSWPVIMQFCYQMGALKADKCI